MTQHDAMMRANHIVRQLGRRMICWDEVLTDEPMDTSIVVMVWRNPETAHKARQRGHQVIYAPGRYCYLDKYQDQPSRQPRAMGGYLPLDSVYFHLMQVAHPQLWKAISSGGRVNASSRSADKSSPDVPHTQEASSPFNALALCLWTEYVPTEKDAERMLWPRVLALSEALKTHPRMPAEFHRWALHETIALRKRGVNAYDISYELGQRREYSVRAKGKARGCSVEYGTPFHPYYPASGKDALTDGRRGGWANTDGRWQGFLGPVDVVVDLQREQTVEEFTVSFLQSVGVEIFLPSDLQVSLSTDARTWQPVAHSRVTPDARPDCVVTYELGTTRGKMARYVRLQAKPDARGGWLFTDEFIVK